MARLARVVEPLPDDGSQRLGARRPIGRPVLDVDGMRSAPRRATIGQPPRNAATGPASRVADITTMTRSGRTSSRTSRSKAQGQVGLQVPLVELVEHDGADASRGRGRRGAGGSGCPR